MTVLAPAPVSTVQFSYDATERRFTAEISSTNGLGRVYDDAADEGLTLVSSRTNRRMVFVVTNVHCDADGDLAWWNLASREGYTMTLFND